MLPPGLGFNALSKKAVEAHKTAKLPRGFFEWAPMIDANDSGFFPYTPAVNIIFGLAASIAMLEEEGLDNVFARHDRLAEATRRAVKAWGLDFLSADPREHSSALTAVMLLTAIMPIRSALSFSSATTCRWDRDSARWRARCSASAISAG